MTKATPAQTPVEPRALRAVASAPSARPSPRDAAWGRVRIARFAIELALPEVDAWQRASAGRWVRLVHDASHSSIELEVTRAERLVKPEECEARARLGRPDLPQIPDEDAIERRGVALADGGRGELSVSAGERRPGTLAGELTLFGAMDARCVALHFATEASAAGREDEVARRLRLVVDHVLPTLKLSSADTRVRAQPFDEPQH